MNPANIVKPTINVTYVMTKEMFEVRNRKKLTLLMSSCNCKNFVLKFVLSFAYFTEELFNALNPTAVRPA